MAIEARRRNTRTVFVATVLALSAPAPVFAETNSPQLQLASIDQLMKLPINELLLVTAVSKRPESVDDAPGIVTIFYRKDIEQFGAKNLRDILDRLPNTLTTTSSAFSVTHTSIRGHGPHNPEETVLILLDGKPLRDSASGGHNADLYLGLPVEMIERVELIRGPGSVLYGTFAFSGIINIKTRPFSETQGQVAATYGSENYKRGTFTGHIEQPNWSFSTSFNVLGSDGESFPLYDNPRGQPGAPPPEPLLGEFTLGDESGYSTVLMGHVGNLSMNAVISDIETTTTGVPLQYPIKESHFGRQQFNLSYDWKISEAWNAELNYSPYHTFHTLPEGDTDSTADFRAHYLEFNADRSLGSSTRILFGISYEHTEMDSPPALAPTPPNAASDMPNNDSVSSPSFNYNYLVVAYTQFEYLMSQRYKWIAGIQMHDAKYEDSDLTGRFGLIARINDNLTTKLLYGEAYRSPTGLHRYHYYNRTGELPIGETLSTWEAQAVYRTLEWDIATSVYYTKVEGDGQLRHRNKGVEFEGGISLTQKFRLLGNASYQKTISRSGAEGRAGIPEVSVKLGGAYQYSNQLTLSLYNVYFGSGTDKADIDATDSGNNAPSSDALNPSTDAFSWLTAQINYRPFGLKEKNRVEFSLFFDNLLDEKPYYYNDTAEENIRLRTARGVYLTSRWQF